MRHIVLESQHTQQSLAVKNPNFICKEEVGQSRPFPSGSSTASLLQRGKLRRNLLGELLILNTTNILSQLILSKNRNLLCALLMLLEIPPTCYCNVE